MFVIVVLRKLPGVIIRPLSYYNEVSNVHIPHTKPLLHYIITTLKIYTFFLSLHQIHEHLNLLCRTMALNLRSYTNCINLHAEGGQRDTGTITVMV